MAKHTYGTYWAGMKTSSKASKNISLQCTHPGETHTYCKNLKLPECRQERLNTALKQDASTFSVPYLNNNCTFYSENLNGKQFKA